MFQDALEKEKGEGVEKEKGRGILSPPRPYRDAPGIRVSLDVAQGALRYLHFPFAKQRSPLRQQLHPCGPQHALCRFEFLLQHTLQLLPSRLLQ